MAIPKTIRRTKSKLKGNNKEHTQTLKLTKWANMKDREEPCPPIVSTDFNLDNAGGDEFDPDVNDIQHPMSFNMDFVLLKV